ncbi:MAG: hypothetical protein WC728_10245 [Elusimicrobiota bacterium]
MEEHPPLKITINGKVYHSLEDVPPELREMIRGQIKGAFQKAFKVEKRFNVSLGESSDIPVSQSPSPADSPTVRVESFAWLLWALFGVGVVLALAYFIKRV